MSILRGYQQDYSKMMGDENENYLADTISTMKSMIAHSMDPAGGQRSLQVDRPSGCMGCGFVLLPDSTFRGIWDFMQIISLMWVSITIPLFAAFNMDPNTTSVLFWWDSLIDLYFIVDVFINFHSGARPTVPVRTPLRPPPVGKPS